jgi:hypothetical protein
LVPGDPVTEGRWLRALEVTGFDGVRACLLKTSEGLITRDRGTEHIPRGFVETWMRDEELTNQADRWNHTVLIWTVVAAVAIAGIIVALLTILQCEAAHFKRTASRCNLPWSLAARCMKPYLGYFAC